MTSRSIRTQAVLPAALAVIALAGLSACSPKPSEASQAAVVTPTNVKLTADQQRHVSIFTVADGSYHRTIEASGVVDFDNDQATSVLAPFSGPVTRLLVQPGDRVVEGQALAMVDSPDFSSAVNGYRKAISAAQNSRRLADVDKDLLAHNSIAIREAQQAETDAVGAEADRDAALQALVSLKVDPQAIKAIQAGRPAPRIDGVIRAPIGGTLVEKLITPGQLLEAGATPSFTIADLSKVWVMAQVSEADAPSVAVGDQVTVETNGQSLHGVVDNIAALVNADTRAVLARVVVANPGSLLRKSMYVRAHIEARQANTGLQVPVSAVLRDDENLPFVYVVDASGGYARRHITLGYRSGDRYEAPQGLRPGDRVVADGGIFIQFVETQ
jgi:cobalt-zinc-cadmium efflux system membrane fusion protein